MLPVSTSARFDISLRVSGRGCRTAGCSYTAKFALLEEGQANMAVAEIHDLKVDPLNGRLVSLGGRVVQNCCDLFNLEPQQLSGRVVRIEVFSSNLGASTRSCAIAEVRFDNYETETALVYDPEQPSLTVTPRNSTCTARGGPEEPGEQYQWKGGVAKPTCLDQTEELQHIATKEPVLNRSSFKRFSNDYIWKNGRWPSCLTPRMPTIRTLQSSRECEEECKSESHMLLEQVVTVVPLVASRLEHKSDANCTRVNIEIGVGTNKEKRTQRQVEKVGPPNDNLAQTSINLPQTQKMFGSNLNNNNYEVTESDSVVFSGEITAEAVQTDVERNISIVNSSSGARPHAFRNRCLTRRSVSSSSAANGSQIGQSVVSIFNPVSRLDALREGTAFEHGYFVTTDLEQLNNLFISNIRPLSAREITVSAMRAGFEKISYGSTPIGLINRVETYQNTKAKGKLRKIGVFASQKKTAITSEAVIRFGATFVNILV
jgi:hypothetical protein